MLSIKHFWNQFPEEFKLKDVRKHVCEETKDFRIFEVHTFKDEIIYTYWHHNILIKYTTFHASLVYSLVGLFWYTAYHGSRVH
jgi:hypothetical protein